MSRKTLAISALLALAACRKEAAVETKPAAVVAEKAVAAPAEISPTNLPASPSPAAAPAVDPKRPRVSMQILLGNKMLQNQANAGDAVTFRLTLLDAEGKRITQVDPLLGGKLLLLVARADLGWSTVLRAAELSQRENGTHDFTLVFPFSGIHRLWFLFRVNGVTYTEEISFSLAGKPWVGKELPELENTWAGENGLGASLHFEPQAPKTCEPLLLSTSWTRKGKQVRMAAEPDQPTTWYIAIESGLGEVLSSTPEDLPTNPPTDVTQTVAAKLGGDLGTAALLKPSRPGRYRVLAVASPQGAKPGQVLDAVAAPFVLTVLGEMHETGCPK